MFSNLVFNKRQPVFKRKLQFALLLVKCKDLPDQWVILLPRLTFRQLYLPRLTFRWSFRWSEILWLSEQNLVYTRREPNVANSKLDWTVVFTARYARRKGKTLILGARLRKPSNAVADLLRNHEGDIPEAEAGQSPSGSQCGIVQTGKDGQEPAGLH